MSWLLSHTHLQRHLRVKFKLGDELGPQLEFFGLWIYIIVKDGSLGRELDCLELCQPPFAEFCPVVHKLSKQSKSESRLYRVTEAWIGCPGIRCSFLCRPARWASSSRKDTLLVRISPEQGPVKQGSPLNMYKGLCLTMQLGLPGTGAPQSHWGVKDRGKGVKGGIRTWRRVGAYNHKMGKCEKELQKR